MDPLRPDISVVILCYRSEEFVREFVSKMQETLERKRLRYELVLVANYFEGAHPPDRTPAIVTELAQQDPRIRTVIRPKQGMMGWDMRAGIEAATGETVAVIDGDGQMPAEDVIAVYEKLREGGYDMVKTYRAKRYDGAVRVAVSSIYNAVFRCLFPAAKVRDVNSKPKIVTHQALRQLVLESDGWFVDAEIVLRASALGLRIGEVPTVFYSNQRRASFVRPSAILEFVRELIRFRLKTLRRHGIRT